MLCGPMYFKLEAKFIAEAEEVAAAFPFKKRMKKTKEIILSNIKTTITRGSERLNVFVFHLHNPETDQSDFSV